MIYTHITNPINGKLFLLDSKSGKKILNKYINQIAGADSNSDKIFQNTPINRCSYISEVEDKNGIRNREYRDSDSKTPNYLKVTTDPLPFEIGDKFKIVIGSHIINDKKTRWNPGKINKLIGIGQYHSWIEITSKKNKCKYSFGLAMGEDGGTLLKPGSNSVILSPDFAIEKCRSRMKQCIDSQNSNQDYIVYNRKNEEIININKGELDGCRYVCGGIQSSDPPNDINNYYPNFLDVKSGTLKHVHIRILEWFINNSFTDDEGISETTVPFKYLLTSNVLGMNLYNKWKKNDPEALANCQTFASDFHSNPTYIFYKLFQKEHDSIVEKEKTELEIKIAHYRWNILKNNLKHAVKIEKTLDIIEDTHSHIDKLQEKLNAAKTRQGKNILVTLVKKEQSKVKTHERKLDTYYEDITHISNVAELSNQAYIEHLKDEKQILKEIKK